MKYRIEFSTGKKITLDEEEFRELLDSVRPLHVVYHPHNLPPEWYVPHHGAAPGRWSKE